MPIMPWPTSGPSLTFVPDKGDSLEHARPLLRTADRIVLRVFDARKGFRGRPIGHQEQDGPVMAEALDEGIRVVVVGCNSRRFRHVVSMILSLAAPDARIQVLDGYRAYDIVPREGGGA